MNIEDIERVNKLNGELEELKRMLKIASYSSNESFKERESYLTFNGSKLEIDKYTEKNFIEVPKSMFKPLVKKLKKHYQQCIIEIEAEINSI